MPAKQALLVQNNIMYSVLESDRFVGRKLPHAPPSLRRGQPAGGRGVISFITETYLTTFVSNFFHLTNFLFVPADALGHPEGPWGILEGSAGSNQKLVK